jgi:TPR repeat protein
VRRHLEESEPWLLAALEDDEPNACFNVSRLRESRQSFLGDSPVGVTKWHVARDTLSVRLWISPDAGYVAQFALDGPTLTGRGYSWVPGERYHATDELILLSRRGPPDLDRCFEAAETVVVPR